MSSPGFVIFVGILFVIIATVLAFTSAGGFMTCFIIAGCGGGLIGAGLSAYR